MTKAPRAKETPIQLKDSRETLILRPVTTHEQHEARLAVCGIVRKAHYENERAQIDAAKELLDILGLLK